MPYEPQPSPWTFSRDDIKAIEQKIAEQNRDAVHHPVHYNSHPSGVEVIQITEHMNFCLGNAVKYILRCDYKGRPIEDLEKARWYIDRLIRATEGQQSQGPAPHV